VHVARPRLTEVIASSGVALVDAPGGYGKTALAQEVAERLGVPRVSAVLRTRTVEPAALVGELRRSLLGSGSSDLAGALGENSTPPDEAIDGLVGGLAERTEGIVLVVDEAHRLGGDANQLVGDLAARMPDGHHLLVLGRGLDVDAPDGAVRLDAAALRFTDEEVAAVLGPDTAPAVVARVVRATEGWPAAVAVAARLADEADGVPARLEQPGAALTELIDDLLAECEPTAVAAFGVLSHLPLLSPEVASCVGSRAWDDAVAAGLPLVAAERGWWDLPDPVREVLGARAPLRPDVARRVAAVYADRGELAVACTFLAEVDDHGGVGELVATRHWRELEQLDLAELQGLLRAVPVQPSCARAYLAAARLAEAVGAFGQRAELLDTAHTAADGDGPLVREIQAEQAIDCAINGEVDAAEDAAADVQRAASPRELAARGRALVAVGRSLAFRREAGSLVGAEAPLVEAASLFARIHEPEWRAGALLVLGYGVHYATGALDRAVDRLTEGLRALAFADRRRAAFATYLAQVLGAAGRLDEAEATLSEATEIGHVLGDHRVRAYAAWTGALLAAQRGDRGRTIELVLEVERHPGDWFVHPTGAEFLADAATALGRVGDDDACAAYLQRAEERAAALGHPEIAEPARALFEARVGDPARAEELLAALPASPQVPPREHWRLLLFRALAAGRRDDPAAAGLADRAFAAAAIMGYPDLPFLIEHEVAEAVATTTAERPGPRREIRLLGGFSVTADGATLDVAPGRSSDLVKMLALTDAPLPTDEVIETLWPEVDPATGRSRLRNLLNRLRGMVGGLVVRDGETLALAPGVAVDARDFDAEARSALAATGADRLGVARSALARYSGELLPADRYADWTAAPRERLRRRYLEVLDVLAADAEERGDLDEAIRRLGEAIESEPLDEPRYVRAATLCLAQGRRGSAGAFVERATAVLDDLGLPRSAELEAVARTISG
jgi:DNA-binding SARP family transcriptional activator/ATP/maltotriose-dependent transcriptional regulator MalT